MLVLLISSAAMNCKDKKRLGEEIVKQHSLYFLSYPLATYTYTELLILICCNAEW